MRTLSILCPLVVVVTVCNAQTAPPQQKPEVRVNYLNVCSPGDSEAAEIGQALQLPAEKPAFAADFEVARGRSTMTEQPLALNSSTIVSDAPVSRWVRVRKEFDQGSPFSNVQYSFSSDESGMTETIVFRARDVAKGDVLQISLQDTVTSGTPEAVVSNNTPVNRVRIERRGKSSLVVARCESTDQAKYEPLFRRASLIMARYRTLLGVQRTVPAELARVGAMGHKPPARKKP